MKYVYLLLEFLLGFLFVLLYYKLVVLKKEEKFNKKKLPVELQLFLNSYNVNTKKKSYRNIMKDLSILFSISIALILIITEVTSSFILKLVIALPLVLLFLKLSIILLGFIYKKKGLIKDVQS